MSLSEKDPALTRRCDGCGKPAGEVPAGRIRFDKVSRKDLCDRCWAAVDLRRYPNAMGGRS